MRLPLKRAGLFGVFAIVVPLLISGCDNPVKGGYGAGQSGLPDSRPTISLAAGTQGRDGCFAAPPERGGAVAAAEKSARLGDTDGH